MSRCTQALIYKDNLEYNIKQIELLYDIGQISIENLLKNYN